MDNLDSFQNKILLRNDEPGYGIQNQLLARALFPSNRQRQEGRRTLGSRFLRNVCKGQAIHSSMSKT